MFKTYALVQIMHQKFGIRSNTCEEFHIILAG